MGRGPSERDRGEGGGGGKEGVGIGKALPSPFLFATNPVVRFKSRLNRFLHFPNIIVLLDRNQ